MGVNTVNVPSAVLGCEKVADTAANMSERDLINGIIIVLGTRNKTMYGVFRRVRI